MTLERDIQTQYFGRLLPLFPPPAEASLKSASAQDLQRVNFRDIFTVQGTLEISQLIEDFVLADPGVADVHVSFQAFSRFANQQEWHYGRVTKASTGLWLHGVPEVQPPKIPQTIILSTSRTPLEEYWSVIAYGLGVHMTRLAEVVKPADRLPKEPRMYEASTPSIQTSPAKCRKSCTIFSPIR